MPQERLIEIEKELMEIEKKGIKLKELDKVTKLLFEAAAIDPDNNESFMKARQGFKPYYTREDLWTQS